MPSLAVGQTARRGRRATTHLRSPKKGTYTANYRTATDWFTLVTQKNTQRHNFMPFEGVRPWHFAHIYVLRVIKQISKVELVIPIFSFSPFFGVCSFFLETVDHVAPRKTGRKKLVYYIQLCNATRSTFV